MNSNGHITFFEPSGTYVPGQFPLANDLQLISPFWADSDTSNSDSGLVWYRIATDPTSLLRAMNDIRKAFPNQRSFRPIWLLIATWDHVGVYPMLAHVVSLAANKTNLCYYTYDSNFYMLAKSALKSSIHLEKYFSVCLGF